MNMRINLSFLLFLTSLLAARSAWAACTPPKPGGLIENRWTKLGGCDPKNPLGVSLAPEIRNPYTGGLSQDFENGQIVVYDRWAAGSAGQMAGFVILAYVNKTQVHVEWGDTSPFSYDLFNVRWDFDGIDDQVSDQHKGGIDGIFSKDPQQGSAAGGSSGSYDFTVDKTGVLRIYVEGCDTGFLSSTCRQGFSYPVTIDLPEQAPLPRFQMVIPASKTGFATPTQLVKPAPLSDAVGEGVVPDAGSANIVTELLCDGSSILESSGPHEGEINVNTAIALLRKAQDMTIQCQNLPDKTYQTDPIKFRTWLNDRLRAAKVVSQPGTDAAFVQGLVGAITGVAIALLIIAAATVVASWLLLTYSAEFAKIAAVLGIAVGAVIGFLTCDTHGDYDMRLVRLVQISYLYDSVLEQSTKDHIRNDLLTAKGPASNRREYVWVCWLPTFVPESENHILMTESSRFLTNQLIAEDAIRRGQPVPPDNDNDANGMTDWFLGHLQGFMQNDFYEYNARPYTFQARMAIQNLSDYAVYPGSTCWRFTGGAPMPPAPRACDVKRGARIVLDYLAAKFAVSSNGLRRVVPFRRQPERKNYPYLFGIASDEELYTYLAFANGSKNFWLQRYGFPTGGAAENLLQAAIGEFRPSPVITDIMSDAQPYPNSFQRFYFNRQKHNAVEIYYRTPDYLISAGGIHDDGRLSFFGDTEDALPMSTTLMFTDAGLDRREFVSIKGSDDEKKRMNTCVGPAFACGLNPWIPPGIPKACQLVSGNWTFLDFAAKSPGCDINYGGGYFVVVYSAPCQQVTCQESFGFFEVSPWQSGGGLPDQAKRVLAANPNPFHEATRNAYVGASGRTFYFIPAPMDYKPVADNGELWDEWGMLETSDPGGINDQIFDGNIPNWALASGELVHSDKHTGCVIVDNPRMQQRLVLDFSDKDHPKRTRVWLQGDECSCPMADGCWPSHHQ